MDGNKGEISEHLDDINIANLAWQAPNWRIKPVYHWIQIYISPLTLTRGKMFEPKILEFVLFNNKYLEMENFWFVNYILKC